MRLAAGYNRNTRRKTLPEPPLDITPVVSAHSRRDAAFLVGLSGIDPSRVETSDYGWLS